MSSPLKIVLRKFLIWRYKHIPEKQFIYILSAVIGLLAGLVAVTIKNLVHLIQNLLEGQFIKDLHQAFYFIFPLIGLLLVLIIKRKLIKKKIGHGIPSTLFAISKQKGLMPRHQMWASLILAPLTVGFGGSVGLEGPTVATSAAIGSNTARLFHLNQTTRTLLIGAAAAGAMASIFKAPITAIVFAVEIFSLELTMASMIPLLIASICAVLTSYFFFGNDVLLHFTLQESFSFKDVLFYILLGVISASVSVYFSKIYFRLNTFFRSITNLYKRLIVGGVLLGVIIYFVPPLFGEGYETINNILRGDIDPVLVNNIFHTATDSTWIIITLLIGLVIFKVVATSFTFGAGGVGGIFGPTLFTGSVTGYVFALIINHTNLFVHQLSLTNFAMVGMAGLMAGILHAPLTAIFLIAEITGGYELFVPLMIVSSISYIIAKKYVPHNIYHKQLAERGQLITHDKDKNVLMMLDLDKIIETNFILLYPQMTLREVVTKAVAKSSRNHFPVVDEDNQFLGILTLNDIRSIMFDSKLYDTVTVESLMRSAPDIIYYEKHTTEDILNKFKSSGAWNLVVIKEGKYFGFISKSRLLTAYRQTLINVTSI
ncbi:chloride channel protein [Aureibaculum algae]|uniref:Chloride channel protein n=2 Tax=Aureibaculum TaxID=2706948 RepID=A0A5B7U182_9FLAO|nr:MULTISPECIES: chloride channel protein [Aureibaculum]MBJ2173907.1 chloride channel protein [Aureibaculum flavum]QCX40732.1 chloride channel protein [Aureibaculum algae]